MLPPHLHPRAANYVVATMGNTTTYMWEENGAHLITTNLTPGKATLFPAGAMHMMVNTGKSTCFIVLTHFRSWWMHDSPGVPYLCEEFAGRSLLATWTFPR